MTDHRTYYERVLGLRPNGKEQQTAHCPFHEDNRKSLSVNLKTGAWTCHGGCGAGGRRNFEQLLLGAPEKTQPTSKVKVSLRKEAEATYPYRDEHGTILFRKVRYPGKKFANQAKLEGDKWANTLDGVDARPLYNLPAVLKAKNVAVCEGEKDADRVNALFKKRGMKDWAATSNFDGAAGPWREEYKAPLAGKNVVILPDNDEPGLTHAEDIARGAARVATRVCILPLPDLPAKGDVSDYLATHSDKDFLALLKKAEPWVRPSLFLTAAELNAETPPTTPWVVKGLIAESSSAELYGKPKAGKSTFTHDMVSAVLDGKPFLGRATQKGPVVYLTEMPLFEVMAQLKTAHLENRTDLHLLLYQRALHLEWDAAMDEAIDMAKAVGAKLIIVDTFAKWTRIADENSSSETLANFIVVERAMAEGLAVWIESHERKSGGGIADAGRGSNALSGAVGTIAHLKRPEGNCPITYRNLEVISRYEYFSIILNWTGEEYVSLGPKGAVAENLARTAIKEALPRTEAEAVTLKQLLKMVPPKPGSKEPSVGRTTAQNVLKELQGGGVVSRIGKSTKKDPFRFYIREAVAKSREPKY